MYDENSFLHGIAIGRAMKGVDVVLPAVGQIITGTCIESDISVGRSVGIYRNDGAPLAYVGNVPSYTSDFWVDHNNRFYTVQNNRLIVKDGISGEILDDTIEAYGFRVAGSKTCCAFKSSQDSKEWVVILPDGSRSAPIQILSSNNGTPSFGYRNGIIGVCVGTTGSWAGVDAYTYSATGQYLATMQKGGELGAYTTLVLPISETAIVYAINHLGAFFNYLINNYVLASVTGYQTHDMWAESGYSVYYQGTSNVWLGATQSHVYVSARHYDSNSQSWTNEYYTGRFAIEHYDGLELLRTEISEGSPYSSTSATQMGTIVHTITAGGTPSRTMLDLATMSDIYGEVLTNIPDNPLVRENEANIWISGMGVYKKTPTGWLIYPTSTYPRHSPWDKLGYAMNSMRVGSIGRAAIMFE